MDDWFMRQIESFAENFARNLLNKPQEHEEVIELRQYSGDDLVYSHLRALLSRLDFCAAEDLLWEQLQPGDPASLLLAEEFYRQLGGFGDEILEANGFSRLEVTEGLERALDYIRGVEFT